MKRLLTILIVMGLVIGLGILPAAAAGEKGVVTIKKGEPVHIAYWFVVSGPNASLGMDTVRGALRLPSRISAASCSATRSS